MMTGTVKWFNKLKGYGFIQPEKDNKEVFVHISVVRKAGIEMLESGQKISYQAIEHKGRARAHSIAV